MKERDYVIIIDRKNRKIGTMDKLMAHEKGVLHRAFSVFIFDSNGNLILQRRAENKYHSPLLWSNTCCGHPKPEETFKSGALRRLKEELGIKCKIKKFGTITYNLKVGDLIEHEYNALFFGFYDGDFKPDPNEVAEIKKVNLNFLLKDVKENPQNYTKWFLLILERYSKELKKISRMKKL